MRLILLFICLCPSLTLGVLLGASGGQQSAVGDQPRYPGRRITNPPQVGNLPHNETEAAARCVLVGETPDQRVSPPPMIAPGAAPLLKFRYYEGAVHHRYGNADLMLDDAGH